MLDGQAVSGYPDTTSDIAVAQAAEWLKDFIALELDRFAREICGVLPGTPEPAKARGALSAERVAKSQRFYLVKVRIAVQAGVDATDDVVKARLFGASWQQLGDALGTTRQTAHEKYAKQCEQGSLTRGVTAANPLPATGSTRSVVADNVPDIRIVRCARVLEDMIIRQLDRLAADLCGAPAGSLELAKVLDSPAAERAAFLRDLFLVKAGVAAEAGLDPVGYVVNARLFGASWQQLGDALGTTRQAAHEKYARMCKHAGLVRELTDPEVLEAAELARSASDAEERDDRRWRARKRAPGSPGSA